ncbi:MAG: hypothetical protein JSR46_00375 [Verrucomicrobia bacterium]|nr:hypothetical protein [Verrucomicrobiota bacterium]
MSVVSNVLTNQDLFSFTFRNADDKNLYALSRVCRLFKNQVIFFLNHVRKEDIRRFEECMITHFRVPQKKYFSEKSIDFTSFTAYIKIIVDIQMKHANQLVRAYGSHYQDPMKLINGCTPPFEHFGEIYLSKTFVALSRAEKFEQALSLLNQMPNEWLCNDILKKQVCELKLANMTISEDSNRLMPLYKLADAKLKAVEAPPAKPRFLEIRPVKNNCSMM